MEQIDFSEYRVIKLVNNEEFIVGQLKYENDFSLKFAGLLPNFGNNWVDIVINKSNILYNRELSDSEKRIVRQVIK